jgi:hypothetical protein
VFAAGRVRRQFMLFNLIIAMVVEAYIDVVSKRRELVTRTLEHNVGPLHRDLYCLARRFTLQTYNVFIRRFTFVGTSGDVNESTAAWSDRVLGWSDAVWVDLITRVRASPSRSCLAHTLVEHGLPGSAPAQIRMRLWHVLADRRRSRAVVVQVYCESASGAVCPRAALPSLTWPRSSSIFRQRRPSRKLCLRRLR